MIREHRRPRGGVPPSAAEDAPATAVPRDGARTASEPPDAAGGGGQVSAARAQLPEIPLAGFTRRRLAWILAALVAAWILFTFGRQVGDAADASARAERARATNTTLAAELDRLRAELAFIQQPKYVALQARAFGVGGRGERQFTLAAGAPTLPPDAPGSATQRIGYRVVTRSPFDAWLIVLFGSRSGG
jgi:hypothetical protein